MTRDIKYIVAVFFCMLMVCKATISLVATFSEHQYINVVSQNDPAESENEAKETEKKLVVRDFVLEEVADIISPLVIELPKCTHGHYMYSTISPLTDLSVFTPPPELA